MAETYPQGEPLIRVEGLCKRYADRVILDHVNLTVQAGETVALIGPSGGGKSTLLRSINGLASANEGTIVVGPHRLDPRSGAAARRAVRRLVGMVFQDFQLFPHLSALDNVCEAPRRVLGQPAQQARAAAQSLLERVGLGDRTDAFPDQLSGGQKQRVAIARALAMSPRGLLCDEVTSALDPELKHEVLAVLEQLKREGLTLVMVTHEIGFARRAADRVLVLAGGRIIEQGPPEQVLDAPETDRTRQFLKNVLG